MYTLVTRNEKNFDERGTEHIFSTKGAAVRVARAFMRRAVCAGASAIVFFNGWTVFEANTSGEKMRRSDGLLVPSRERATQNPGMTMRETFEAELAAHGLAWCRACSSSKGHARGFVLDADPKTVHLDSEIATRSSFHRGLHEIGHAVHDQRGMRRFEKERQAEDWATERMRQLGWSVPRKVAAKGRRYVSRMKRWGDNVRRSLTRNPGRVLPKLTRLEMEILNHRLAASDAIADVLDGEFARADVEEVAGLLQRGLVDKADDVAGPLVTDAVLGDAVDGSTFLGSASDESEQKQSAIFAAGERLADKISAFIGRPVRFPDF